MAAPSHPFQSHGFQTSVDMARATAHGGLKRPHQGVDHDVHRTGHEPYHHGSMTADISVRTQGNPNQPIVPDSDRWISFVRRRPLPERVSPLVRFVWPFPRASYRPSVPKQLWRLPSHRRRPSRRTHCCLSNIPGTDYRRPWWRISRPWEYAVYTHGKRLVCWAAVI